MNKLRPEVQATVIGGLVEGASIRSMERMTGVHRDTIMRLAVRVGGECQEIMHTEMQGLSCQRLEVDEIWCYVGKKQRHVRPSDDLQLVGDQWVWVALDAETKLVPTFQVGKRDASTAYAFMTDLASRLQNRVQLSSDGLRLYAEAVEAGFGHNIDYATIVKSYEGEPIGDGKYSTPKVVGVEKTPMVGKPNRRLISTSYVERQNLTMRMQMRRFTRLTNGFSKKLENLQAPVALHFVWYNFVRRHQTVKSTPAMAAGLTRYPWTIRDLIERTD